MALASLPALVAGIRLLRAGIAGGAAGTVFAAAVVLYIATARPTVECERSGVGTSAGPWWLPNLGEMRSSGGGSATSVGGPTSATGRIERGDGVTITYRCEGVLLAEFEIRR